MTLHYYAFMGSLDALIRYFVPPTSGDAALPPTDPKATQGETSEEPLPEPFQSMRCVREIRVDLRRMAKDISETLSDLQRSAYELEVHRSGSGTDAHLMSDISLALTGARLSHDPTAHVSAMDLAFANAVAAVPWDETNEDEPTPTQQKAFIVKLRSEARTAVAHTQAAQKAAASLRSQIAYLQRRGHEFHEALMTLSTNSYKLDPELTLILKDVMAQLKAAKLAGGGTDGAAGWPPSSWYSSSSGSNNSSSSSSSGIGRG
jgi:hypothetical protein